MSDVQDHQSLEELKSSIIYAMDQIKRRKSTPKKCGMGQMFAALHSACPETHTKLLAEYKPISNAYFAQKQSKRKKAVISQIEKMMTNIEKNLIFEEDDFDDAGNLLPHVWDKAILDASNRIDGKKKKIPAKPARDPNEPHVRDRSGYKFNGNVYGKGPLVLAVVKCVVEADPDITSSKLKEIFPDELLKSYGIFKPTDVAEEASKKRKRYFLKEDQIISVRDCRIAVCNQFTAGNIGAFIDKAREIGYEIKEDDA